MRAYLPSVYPLVCPVDRHEIAHVRSGRSGLLALPVLGLTGPDKQEISWVLCTDSRDLLCQHFGRACDRSCSHLLSGSLVCCVDLPLSLVYEPRLSDSNFEGELMVVELRPL